MHFSLNWGGASAAEFCDPKFGEKSGKSSIVKHLLESLHSSSWKGIVDVISEDSLGLNRNSSYKDMVCEKNLRGVLRSAVDRAVSKDRIVIVDSLNNIKGYRYELWCLARAAATLYCLVHCDVSSQTAMDWNEIRNQKGEACYSQSIMQDLISRFERPDSKNRWDSPLFEIQTCSYTYCYYEKETVNFEKVNEIVSFLTEKNKNQFGKKNSNNLQPTVATQNTRLSETNMLYELDRATQEILHAITEAKNSNVNGDAVGNLTISKDLPQVVIGRNVSVPELRRHKRTFLKLTSQTALSGPAVSGNTLSIKRLFIDYLNQELAANP